MVKNDNNFMQAFWTQTLLPPSIATLAIFIFLVNVQFYLRENFTKGMKNYSSVRIIFANT